QTIRQWNNRDVLSLRISHEDLHGQVLSRLQSMIQEGVRKQIARPNQIGQKISETDAGWQWHWRAELAEQPAVEIPSGRNCVRGYRTLRHEGTVQIRSSQRSGRRKISPGVNDPRDEIAARISNGDHFLPAIVQGKSGAAHVG